MGLGVVWIDQLVPFHRSTNVTLSPALLMLSPTAVQAVLEVHDMPRRALPVAPRGFGRFWMDQLVPFQRSAKVCSSLSLFWEYPTAMQSVVEVQDTPSRLLKAAPLPSAVDWIDQLVPLQCPTKAVSTMAFPLPLLAKAPTAVQALVEAQDTALS